jgi:hypothetical protein
MKRDRVGFSHHRQRPRKTLYEERENEKQIRFHPRASEATNTVGWCGGKEKIKKIFHRARESFPRKLSRRGDRTARAAPKKSIFRLSKRADDRENAREEEVKLTLRLTIRFFI